MIVCHCRGISDTIIRRLVAEGVQTLGGIQGRTGAARCCEPCRREVCEILREEAAKAHRTADSEPSVNESAAAA